MNCIYCRYSLLKDGHSKCTYEEGECIKISLLEKENAELKNKLYKARGRGREMTKEELKPIDVSKYKVTETGQVLKMTKECLEEIK